MYKRLRKIKSRNGVTLAETLVTVLLLSIVLSVVGGATTVAVRVYKQVRNNADAQTLLSTTAMAIAGNLHYSNNVEPEADSGTVTVTSLYSETANATIWYQNSSGNTAEVELCYKGSDDNTVSTPVVTDQTSTLNLRAVLSGGLLYDYDTHCYTYTLQIFDGENTEPIETETFNVQSVLVY